MPNYLAAAVGQDVNEGFTSRSCFSEEQAAELEAKRPGYLMTVAAEISAEIDSRLVKRGDVPFLAPYPPLVMRWVADLLTPRAFEALGSRPSDELQSQIYAREQRVLDDLKEAADPVNGLRLLPLQGDSTALQATLPETLASSESSAYTWRHRQADRLRSNRRYG